MYVTSNAPYTRIPRIKLLMSPSLVMAISLINGGYMLRYYDVCKIEEDIDRVGSYQAVQYEFPFPEESLLAPFGRSQSKRDERMDKIFKKYLNCNFNK